MTDLLASMVTFAQTNRYMWSDRSAHCGTTLKISAGRIIPPTGGISSTDPRQDSSGDYQEGLN